MIGHSDIIQVGKMPKIIFESKNKFTRVYDQPEPASKNIPEWWKSLPQYINDDKFNMQSLMHHAPQSHGVPNVGVKRCLPVLDSISAGYIIKLHCDIQFKYIPQSKTQEPFFSSVVIPISKWTPEQFDGYDIPNNYTNQVYKWNANWIIKTPPGYSCIFTHPIGYNSLPFKTITGVVDTDKLQTDINSPFILQKDFEGIIEAGTPIAQVIPFKREEWNSEFKEITHDEVQIRTENLLRKIVGSYGKNFRSKKNYK